MNEKAAKKLKFEEALEELERIVRELEDGQIGLEDSLARYEQGVMLLRRCYQQLQEAEQRIRVLTGQDESGQAALKPFNHAASVEVKSDAKDALPLWKTNESE